MQAKACEGGEVAGVEWVEGPGLGSRMLGSVLASGSTWALGRPEATQPSQCAGQRQPRQMRKFACRLILCVNERHKEAQFEDPASWSHKKNKNMPPT